MSCAVCGASAPPYTKIFNPISYRDSIYITVGSQKNKNRNKIFISIIYIWQRGISKKSKEDKLKEIEDLNVRDLLKQVTQ